MKNNSSEHTILWPIFLIVILLIKSAAIVALILYGNIGLSPDEAQYWTWSRMLDWGYYSKPPGIAWQIWLGTHIFGNSELGVRAASILIGTGISLSIYALARTCTLSAKTAFWAAVAFTLTPIGLLSSFLAITDGGLVLFWTLACIPIASSLATQKPPSYLLVGLFILLGALFKWPIYLFWPLILLFMPFYHQLARFEFLLGVLISLLGLLPSLFWNYSHDWATFKHVWSTVAETAVKEHPAEGNILEFLGSQAFLFSPILFILLLVAFAAFFRNLKLMPSPIVFCGISSFLLLLSFSILSIFQKVQGNWVAFAYPTGVVFLTWFAMQSTAARRWLYGGITLAVVLSACAVFIPYVQSHAILSKVAIPYKFNPFRHQVGWNRLQENLKDAGYDPKEHFLFSDKYQTTSVLSFYSAGQKRAYFLNLQGIRKNQFSYWPSMTDEQLGKTGFFVLTENSPHLEKHLSSDVKDYEKLLSKYFKEVHFVGLYPLFTSYGAVSKGALIFKCTSFNGFETATDETW